MSLAYPQRVISQFSTLAHRGKSFSLGRAEVAFQEFVEIGEFFER
jgi:hypothetical protein